MANLNGLLGGSRMPSFLGGLLGDEEEYRRLQQQAQSSSLGDMANAFYRAGAPSRVPGGSTLQAINEGMMAQESGYKRSMNEQLQEKIAQQKMRQEMMAREQQTKAQGLLPQLMGQAVRPETPLMDNYGMEQAGPNMPRPAQMNEDVLNKLLMNPGGQSVLKNFMDARKLAQGETFTLGQGDRRLKTGINGETIEIASGNPKASDIKLSSEFAGAVDMLGLPRMDASQYTPAQRALIVAQVNRMMQSKKPPGTVITNNMGGGAADYVIKRMGTLTQAATTANSALINLNTIDSALEGAVLGPAASVRTDLLRIGTALGISGDNAEDTLAQTSKVVQGLAQAQLNAAAQMAGQGTLSDSERKILAKAAAGVQNMLPSEIRAAMGVLRKTAEYQLAEHQSFLQKFKADPNSQGMAGYYEVTPPPPAPASLNDAIAQQRARNAANARR